MSTRRLRRQRVREAVQTTNEGDLGSILRLLDSPEPAVREHAIVAIGRQRNTEAIPELVRRVAAEEQSVRVSITTVLADFRDPACRETLRSLVDDEYEGVSRLALRGLGRIRDPEAVDIAISWYPGGSVFTRQEALDALAELRSEASREALRGLLATERHWWWRRAIRKALRKVEGSLSAAEGAEGEP
jgi:HEAT repeat protein